MYYTGIGSRETPQSVLDFIDKIALKLQSMGYILRSGGADGADLAFEWNVSQKEVYLPWRGFNNNQSMLYSPSAEAFDIASPHHPAWNKLPQAVKKLMARNAHQVLGQDLSTPSQFVLCWTPDACVNSAGRSRKTGGTGLAISLASSLGIDVHNLANPKTYTKWEEFVNRKP